MQASKLPPVVDRAWEKIGGGPADLYFPEEFLGVWNVESTLTSIKLPLGTDYVPDLKVGSAPIQQLSNASYALHQASRMECFPRRTHDWCNAGQMCDLCSSSVGYTSADMSHGVFGIEHTSKLADAGQVVKRAEDEDLNKDVRYHVAFIRNPQGRVITDVSPRPRQLSDMQYQVLKHKAHARLIGQHNTLQYFSSRS